MHVTLSPQLEALVQSKVDSGRYNDANDVIREALELLDEHESTERLRAALAIGEEQFARGEYIAYTPGFFAEAKQRAKENAARGHQVKPDVLP